MSKKNRKPKTEIRRLLKSMEAPRETREEVLRTIRRVNLLRVKPGDIIVISVPLETSQAVCEKIRAKMLELLPGFKTLIKPNNYHVGLIRESK